jgi:hypothetical protein
MDEYRDQTCDGSGQALYPDARTARKNWRDRVITFQRLPVTRSKAVSEATTEAIVDQESLA